jgi:oligopeptide/dipeptide ABC transporter ATP-binding protein
MAMKHELLEVKNLKTYFYTEEGVVPAVDGLSFSLSEGKALAIVGESGCGKSVTALSILRILSSPPGRIEGGEILYRGEDLLKKSEKEMRNIRGNKISMVFQEPLTSLNPVFTIGSPIIESFVMHQGMKKNEAREKAIDMLALVGIPDPERTIDRYPHQLSGGMRQRVMIAIALACKPEILIADEPTTALDVTIQAQILQLLMTLKEKINTSIILITHDLGIVAQVAQNVIVMYAGQAVEYTDVRSIFKNTLHPYTLGLLKSVPVPGQQQEYLFSIKGNIPRAKDYPVGCRFSPRCEFCFDKCVTAMPPLAEVAPGHFVCCWKALEEATRG